MKEKIASLFNDFVHLFFPHNCLGCGTDVLRNDALLCTKCFAQLPETGFADKKDNPVEKIFHGRIKIKAAASAYYFTKDSLLQHLIVQLKYNNNKDAGFYLGNLLGNILTQSKRFENTDCILPLPLNPKKETMRGYNQAAVIAEGIAQVWQKPVLKNILSRSIFTETQTQKDRISRWQNMQNVFIITNASAIENKNVLLVDDVVTTGATLEACGQKILSITGTTLSIATVAYTI